MKNIASTITTNKILSETEYKKIVQTIITGKYGITTYTNSYTKVFHKSYLIYCQCISINYLIY